MNHTMTTILRIAFLVILIWMLAAITGSAASVRGPGFAARIGPGRRRSGQCGSGQRRPRWMWGSNGMVGELIPSTGAQPQLVGLNEF